MYFRFKLWSWIRCEDFLNHIHFWCSLLYHSKRQAIVPCLVEVISGVSFCLFNKYYFRRLIVQFHNVGLRLRFIFLWDHNTCEYFLIEIVYVEWNKISKISNSLYIPQVSDFIYLPYKSLNSFRKKGRSFNKSAFPWCQVWCLLTGKQQSIVEISDQESKSVNSSYPQRFCHVNLQSVANQSNRSPNMNSILHTEF